MQHTQELLDVLNQVDPEKYDQNSYDFDINADDNESRCGCAWHWLDVAALKASIHIGNLEEYFDLSRHEFDYIFGLMHEICNVAVLRSWPMPVKCDLEEAIARVKFINTLHYHNKTMLEE